MNLVRGLGLVIGSFLICVVGLVAEAGGGKKNQELIIGKWKMELKERKEDKEITILITVDFFKEGKFKTVEKVGKPIDRETIKEGTYKLIDESTLELAISGEKKGPTRAKIDKLTDDVLNFTGEKGERYEFKRVK